MRFSLSDPIVSNDFWESTHAKREEKLHLLFQGLPHVYNRHASASSYWPSGMTYSSYMRSLNFGYLLGS